MKMGDAPIGADLSGRPHLPRPGERLVGDAYQFQALVIEVVENQMLPIPTRLDARMLDFKLVQAVLPKPQRGLRDSQGDRSYVAPAARPGICVGEGEEGEVHARFAGGVPEKQVISGNIVLVYRFLDQAQPEDFGIEIDQPLRVGTDGGDGMGSLGVIHYVPLEVLW